MRGNVSSGPAFFGDKWATIVCHSPRCVFRSLQFLSMRKTTACFQLCKPWSVHHTHQQQRKNLKFSTQLPVVGSTVHNTLYLKFEWFRCKFCVYLFHVGDQLLSGETRDDWLVHTERGVCVFSCKLPPTLLAKLIRVFYMLLR